jgi:hypothetical protein
MCEKVAGFLLQHLPPNVLFTRYLAKKHYAWDEEFNATEAKKILNKVINPLPLHFHLIFCNSVRLTSYLIYALNLNI